MPEYQTDAVEVSIDDIMKYWMKDYKFQDRKQPISQQWFYDPAKGKVVFVFVSKKE